MNAPRVLIADDMSPRAAQILASMDVDVDVNTGLDQQALAEIISGYDAVLVRSSTRLGADLLGLSDRLKAVGRAGIGVDNVDVGAATERGVIVFNTPFGNTVTTGEHAVAMMMALSRNIAQATASMREGKWEKSKLKGRELRGKTLGIIGLGNVGRVVCECALGLKMNVIGYDPFISAEAAQKLGAEKVELDAVFRRSDYISLHTPLTSETRHLVDEKAFSLMREGVFLINCARGGLIDEDALLVALDKGPVAGAALDVFEQEPPPADYPLRRHPKVILTPHLGASTVEAQVAVAEQIAEQVGAFLISGTVKNAVNAPSMSGDALRSLEPHLKLGRVLGTLAGQVHTGEVDRVEFKYWGDLPDGAEEAIGARGLVQLLRRKIEPAPTVLSAFAAARKRGVKVLTTQCGDHPDYTNCVGIEVIGGGKHTVVRGVVFDRKQTRVVNIDGYLLDLNPKGQALLIANEDRPGVVGAVGSELGRRGINISRLTLGAKESLGKALAIWSTDGLVDDDTLTAIRAQPGVLTALRLEL